MNVTPSIGELEGGGLLPCHVTWWEASPTDVVPRGTVVRSNIVVSGSGMFRGENSSPPQCVGISPATLSGGADKTRVQHIYFLHTARVNSSHYQ